MNDARPIMRVLKCVANLARPSAQFGWLENLLWLVTPQAGQGLAVDKLHRNAARPFVVNEVVNPNDVGMSELEAALSLVLELVKHGPVLNHQIGKKFQRDLAFQFLIARQPDNAHSAASKNFDQRVTAEKLLPAPILTERRLRHVAR